MQMVSAGLSLPFEVTFDSPTLSVGMTVWDITGVTPMLAIGPSPMVLIQGSTYLGKFMPQANHAYVIEKAVYTDNTLAVQDTNYPAGSETIFATEQSGTGGLTQIRETLIGVILPNDPIIGIVRNP